MSDLLLLIKRAKRNNETKLELGNKGLTYIPNDIYQLTQLEILDLSNNKINSLDQKINQLTNLKSLDLSNNSILNLPQQLLQLTQLQVLNLTNNPLSKDYEPLLKQENQTQPKLKFALQQCFGIQGSEREEEEKSNDKSQPGWLAQNQEKSTSNQSNIISELIEKESQLKLEKSKVEQLQSQLDKLNLKTSKQQQGGFGVSPITETVMEIDFSELQIGDVISQGGFSLVHHGFFRGTQVVIKKIFNPNITQELMEELNNEINMLATLRHPNIVLLMGIVSKPPALCIITEYVQKGDLYNLLHKQKIQLTNEQKLHIAKQIACTCVYLHKSRIAHRDLKSLNILLDEGYKVKLCDFGLATKFDDLNTGTQQYSGTPTYMAPEIFQKKGYDQSIDVYSFGTLLWELFANQVPYDGLEPADIMNKVMQENSLEYKASIPKSIYEIIQKCRKINSAQRPNFEEIQKLLSTIKV